MNRQIARLGLVLALVGAVVTIKTAALAATCSGGANCRACKNCKYCRHCSRDGGTCSVCKREAAARKERLRLVKADTRQCRSHG